MTRQSQDNKQNYLLDPSPTRVITTHGSSSRRHALRTCGFSSSPPLWFARSALKNCTATQPFRPPPPMSFDLVDCELDLDWFHPNQKAGLVSEVNCEPHITLLAAAVPSTCGKSLHFPAS
jgi:hypothetical protein